MDKFQAKFTHPNAGWDSGEQGRKYLEPDKLYDLDYIDIYSMHTRIYLKGYPGWFNSVYFTFYYNGQPVPEESFWDFAKLFGFSNIDEWK